MSQNLDTKICQSDVSSEFVSKEFMALKLFKQGFSAGCEPNFLKLKFHRMFCSSTKGGNKSANKFAKKISQTIPKSRSSTKQSTFRIKLVNRDRVCVISGLCAGECEAAHIVDYASGGSFDPENGLLLSRNLHRQFDLFLFSINPATLEVVVSPNATGWSVNTFAKKIAAVHESCKPNLVQHFKKFKAKNSL
jgi:hypothetical protein